MCTYVLKEEHHNRKKTCCSYGAIKMEEKKTLTTVASNFCLCSFIFFKRLSP